MTATHDIDGAYEPRHQSSPTARLLDTMQLYGFQPCAGEPDPRPLPDTGQLSAAISDIFGILGGVFQDTRLETDLDDILWHIAELFHKKAARLQRQLDDNEDRQKRS